MNDDLSFLKIYWAKFPFSEQKSNMKISVADRKL